MIRRPPRSTRTDTLFPTRRSSDLLLRNPPLQSMSKKYRSIVSTREGAELSYVDFDQRSEEHTSELQSLMRISYAVFCLKKKRLMLHLVEDQFYIQHKQPIVHDTIDVYDINKVKQHIFIHLH